MSSFQTRLTEALLAKRLMTPEQLTHVVAEAGRGGTNLIRLLIDSKLVTEEILEGVLAEALNLPTLSLSNYRMDPSLARLIPERVARQHTMIPIAQFGKRLVVAMSDPLDLFALDDVKLLTPYAVDPVLASASEIERAIGQVYGASATLSTMGPREEAQPQGSEETSTTLDRAGQMVGPDAGEDAPVVKAVNLMILEALRKQASDIHLEPLPNGLRVRYRVDGQLIESYQLPKAVQNPLITRVKIMSGLDITEWRLPQDGRFKVRVEDAEVDFRVSVLPITHGTKVVLRVLNQSNLSIGLDRLGFSSEAMEVFKQAVARPHGMVLVTGPTGSGKSTTLYSILQQLNTSTRNLITVEDPVEYQLEGVTQVQVNPHIGLTFASGLRALLRQSPDVVMIGEIRDFETADIAMKASLTGQLVLSTLHTNDAPSAVTRLIDMGVEPFLVASSLTLIEAQRLVRRLCPTCRKQRRPRREDLAPLGITVKPDAVVYEAVGCHLCHGTGYRGRFGIIEVLPVDEHVRELIVTKAQSWAIKRYAVDQLQMTTLREDGFRKVFEGLTTLEEVLRTTSEE